MKVEIYSDVVCPWCYIGERRLTRALAPLPQGDQVDVVFRPYQLFAAGCAACFGSAVRAVAARDPVHVRESTITTPVSIARAESGAFGLAVELLGTFPGLTQQQALALMHAAHDVCPYSRATRGNVDVGLSVA